MKIEYYEIKNGWIVEVDQQGLFREIKTMFFKSKNRALAWIVSMLKKEKVE